MRIPIPKMLRHFREEETRLGLAPVAARRGLKLWAALASRPTLWRNATGIGRAVTDVSKAQIEREMAGRDARATVLTLWQKRESLRSRVKQLDQVVLQRLNENKRLSVAAYRAGEISLAQLLLATRQVLDTRREVLEAMIDLALVRIELEQAAGWHRQPKSS